jgi:hypothetical protein
MPKKSLFEQLLDACPELTESDFNINSGTILLQDDSDGKGAYIAKWEHSLPIPDGFKLGKE